MLRRHRNDPGERPVAHLSKNTFCMPKIKKNTVFMIFSSTFDAFSVHPEVPKRWFPMISRKSPFRDLGVDRKSIENRWKNHENYIIFDFGHTKSIFTQACHRPFPGVVSIPMQTCAQILTSKFPGSFSLRWFAWISRPGAPDFRDFPKSAQLWEAVTSRPLVRFGCRDMQIIPTHSNSQENSVYDVPAPR